MAKQEKIRGAAVRALAIFRRMQEIKKEGLDRISVELKSFLDGLKIKKELDTETLEILDNVYFRRKSEFEIKEDRINQSIELFRSELRGNKQDGISTILLTLSADGDLYRKPKKTYCYPLKKTGLRIEIIRLLIGKTESIPGEYIAKMIGTTYGSTTSAIKKVNSISHRLLDLPKDERLIISKDRGGYKLNPIYHINQE